MNALTKIDALVGAIVTTEIGSENHPVIVSEAKRRRSPMQSQRIKLERSRLNLAL